jgi:hypothetical protein
MDKSPTRCQPCDSFWERDSMYGEHQCVFCGGVVRECSTCGKDHHVRGWNSCDPTKTEMKTCRHPACQERVSKEALQDEIATLRARIADLEALLAGTDRRACVRCEAFTVCLLHRDAVASDEPGCARFVAEEVAGG